MLKRFHQRTRAARCRAIVVATQGGKIKFADANANAWLKQFFGLQAGHRSLPRKVRRWLKEQSVLNSPLVARHGGARLCLKRQPTYAARTVSLLLEIITGAGQESSRRHHALTPRENEVLAWLARGKSYGEIAAILGIKSATVGKHLERIYPKLGVENRTAAASFAAEQGRTED